MAGLEAEPEEPEEHCAEFGVAISAGPHELGSVASVPAIVDAMLVMVADVSKVTAEPLELASGACMPALANANGAGVASAVAGAAAAA